MLLIFSGGITFDVVGEYLTSVADPKAKVTVRALNYEQIFISVGAVIIESSVFLDSNKYNFF